MGGRLMSVRSLLILLTTPVIRTASATIKGFEVMRALKKEQAKFFQFQEGIMGEVRLIERQFGIYTS